MCQDNGEMSFVCVERKKSQGLEKCSNVEVVKVGGRVR
jgi:hypothetical protein